MILIRELLRKYLITYLFEAKLMISKYFSFLPSIYMYCVYIEINFIVIQLGYYFQNVNLLKLNTLHE